MNKNHKEIDWTIVRMKAYYLKKDRFIEIHFDEISSESIRAILKVYDWRWYKIDGCWKNFNNPENIGIARGICDAINPKSINNLESKKRIIFDTADLIIRKNSFYCDKNHQVEDMAGVVYIINRKGEIHSHLIPIAYCHNCNLYYMLEETFASLKNSGILLHQIMSYKKYKSQGRYIDSVNTTMWKKESPLKLWGYSVNKEEDLSDEQRRAILELILDKGIMSRDRELSYLDFFVKFHDSPDAQEKWRDDRKYIEQYEISTAKRVVIGDLIIYR